MSGSIQTVKLWAFGIVATVVIVAALMVSVFRIVVPQVPAYRGEIVDWASGVLGAPVAIGALDLQWRGLRPEVVLREVSFVSADARGAVAAREIRVGLSLRALLQQRRLVPARVTLLEPDVTLVLEGHDAGTGEDWRRMFAGTGHRGELVVSRGRVTLIFDAGRRRVELAGLDLRVASDGARHDLRATTRLGSDIGGLVRVRGHGIGWPNEEGSSATVRVETRGVELVGLQRLGRIGRVRGGRMDAEVALEVVDGEAHRFTVGLRLMSLRWPEGDRVAAVERAAADFAWSRDGDGWEAVLQRLEVGRGPETRISGPVTVAFAVPDAHWDIRAGRVEFDDVATLIEALPWEVGEGVGALLARSPAGTLERASFELRRPPGEDMRYAFEFEGSGLRLDADAARGPLPGFSALDLRLSGTHESGEFHVRVDDGEVDYAWLFRDPIPVTHSRVDGAWTIDDDGWRLATESLHLDNDDLTLDGEAVVERAADGEGSVRIEAGFADARLASKSTYLPVGIMPENLVAWLDRSVLGGVASSGDALFRMRFGGDGERPEPELDIRFHAHDTVLDFADDWPAVERARLDGRFTWSGFSTVLHEGVLAGSRVEGAVGMETYRGQVLDIDARAGDRLDALFDGFRRTPIGSAQWLRQATVAGRGTLDLRIGLNLGAMQAVQPEVEGGVDIEDGSFSVGGFDHPLSDLRGRVHIAGDGFRSDGVHGRLLGGDVEVSARTLRDGAGTARAVEVALAGTLDRTTLVLLSGNEGMPVDGSTSWQARVFAPYDGSQPPILQLESDLEGLAIDFPEPLGKPAGLRQPLAMQIELGLDQRRVVVDAGERIRADATIEHEDGQWRLARGRAHLGPGRPGRVPERDFAVTGRLAEWHITLGQVTPTVAETEFPLTRVDIVIDEFTAWSHPLGEVTLTGTRSELGWYWMLDGERVSGTLDLPDEPTMDSPVRADFARLHLPLAERDPDAGPVHADPRTLPPIAFHAGDFKAGIVHLGEISGLLRPVENGARLEGFTAHRAEMRMTAEADWRMVDGHHRTALRGILDSTDVQPTLSALGYAASIDAAAGHIEADIAWMDSPLVNPLPTLGGTLMVRMERGTLHDLEPGAGRVFGMLSLNALPRRLALDFSDIFRRGLAFDTIQGSFVIEGGNAYTEDLMLQGPAARVDIEGRTGLADRDYDQTATVVGSLASSLTLAGTLLGGPAVGAALLLVSELLRGTLEDMVRVRYHLSGPWEQPVIERL